MKIKIIKQYDATAIYSGLRSKIQNIPIAEAFGDVVVRIGSSEPLLLLSGFFGVSMFGAQRGSK